MIVLERLTKEDGQRVYLVGADGIKYEALSMRSCLEAVHHLLAPEVGQHFRNEVNACIVCTYNREHAAPTETHSTVTWRTSSGNGTH